MATIAMEPARSLSASPDRAIDLVHLARMTFGDRSLEREVLELFDRQAGLLLSRMERAPLETLPALAHTLNGSARGIGAKRVARAAEWVEVAASVGASEVKAALGALRGATEEARALIGELLRAH